MKNSNLKLKNEFQIQKKRKIIPYPFENVKEIILESLQSSNKKFR